MLKKTKIVATISDINCSEDFIRELYDNGMNVVRLNTAHQDFEGTKRVIENVKKVSDKIPFLLDTKGPEIRTTKSEVEIKLERGQEISIEGNSKEECSEDCIRVNYDGFVNDLSEGNRILIDDGDVELLVKSKENNKLLCEVMNSGIVKGKKSVNVPDVHINLPSLSSKDIDYINFAIENGIEFLAHSFVRNKEDVEEIQKILDKNNSDIKIIAKIENQEGVNNIEEILDRVYGVMIARGDLGIEISAEKIPPIQRNIIRKSMEKRKPVIVATQMLHTMIKNPRPTRAEVSDVANAIYLGADAIMLSGETAYGDYPVDSVKIMSKIAREVETHKEDYERTQIKNVEGDIPNFLAKSAVKASMKLPIKAIITDTMTGRTPKYVSAYRGKNPIFALCYDKKVMKELALSYGVYASYSETKKTKDEFIKEIVLPLVEENKFAKEDLIVVLAGNFGPGHGASFIEITQVGNLINF